MISIYCIVQGRVNLTQHLTQYLTHTAALHVD